MNNKLKKGLIIGGAVLGFLVWSFTCVGIGWKAGKGETPEIKTLETTGRVKPINKVHKALIGNNEYSLNEFEDEDLPVTDEWVYLNGLNLNFYIGGRSENMNICNYSKYAYSSVDLSFSNGEYVIKISHPDESYYVVLGDSDGLPLVNLENPSEEDFSVVNLGASFDTLVSPFDTLLNVLFEEVENTPISIDVSVNLENCTITSVDNGTYENGIISGVDSSLSTYVTLKADLGYEFTTESVNSSGITSAFDEGWTSQELTLVLSDYESSPIVNVVAAKKLVLGYEFPRDWFPSPTINGNNAFPFVRGAAVSSGGQFNIQRLNGFTFSVNGNTYNQIVFEWASAMGLAFGEDRTTITANDLWYLSKVMYGTENGKLDIVYQPSWGVKADGNSYFKGSYEWTSDIYRFIKVETLTESNIVLDNVGHSPRQWLNILTTSEGNGYYEGSTGDAFGLLTAAFSAIIPLFSVMVLPNITLGLLLFLPLIGAIIVLIIRVVKK